MENNFLQVEKEKRTLTSLEVAEMVEKDHKDLLRDVRRYSSYLNEGEIALVDFWEESTYIDTKGETRPCYLITKKGCEFIANKTTGVKGAVFTARYINRFHEMESRLRAPVPLDNRLEIAKLILRAPRSRVESIRELYPEYFSRYPENGSFEMIVDMNTAYTKWIEDYGITKEWIGDFPAGEIYNNYMKYCNENRLVYMGKKRFYEVLEDDFGLTRKQRGNGYRYFISA